MPTVTKEFADKLVAGDGLLPELGAEAPDNPRATRIVEYTDVGGRFAYGVTFAHENQGKYLEPSQYVRSPRIYWEYDIPF